MFFNQIALVPRVELADAPFNYQNSAHLEIIGKRLARFKQAQMALYAADIKIVSGILMGTVFWLSSYIVPSVTMAIAGFSYAFYHMGRHAEVARNYREALDDLIQVYNWSMGKDTGNHWYKLGVGNIQSLILTLGPWVAKETIYTWKDADLEPASAMSFAKRKEPSNAVKIKLAQFAAGEQTANWLFHIYGEAGTRGLTDIIKGYFQREVQEIAGQAKDAVVANVAHAFKS
ncbi:MULTISPECIES: hypothetical protein [unclassified Legionella]|uniref:hypothetical protein n=1 Tax=unclassified Legionella TaxID=2622702 RepID=UPI0010561FFE|nr:MULTISPECIES: hypothetical protein [unclassified Legionella]MDI9818995.1 hypothetical protein [Legionella sp. PL877]